MRRQNQACEEFVDVYCGMGRFSSVLAGKVVEGELDVVLSRRHDLVEDDERDVRPDVPHPEQEIHPPDLCQRPCITDSYSSSFG